MTPQPQAAPVIPQIPNTGFVTNYINPPPTNPPGYVSSGVFGNQVYGQPAVVGQVIYGSSSAIAQVTYFPTLVLTDGRIFANFGTGHGYEQVLRQCPQINGQTPWNIIIPPCWAVDRNGRYYVMQQR